MQVSELEFLAPLTQTIMNNGPTYPGENRRLEGEEGERRMAKHFMQILLEKDLPVEMIGSEAVPLLRENDKQEEIVALVRREAAMVFGFPYEESGLEGVADNVIRLVFSEKQESEQGAEELTEEEVVKTLRSLKMNFLANPNLHPNCEWSRVESALRASKKALLAVKKMVELEHRPNVFFSDDKGFFVGTCSPEAPDHTRGAVYDKEALEHMAQYPEYQNIKGEAVGAAEDMGLRLFSLSELGILRSRGDFDARGLVWSSDRKLTNPEEVYCVGGTEKEKTFYTYESQYRLGWRGLVEVPWSDEAEVSDDCELGVEQRRYLAELVNKSWHMVERHTGQVSILGELPFREEKETCLRAILKQLTPEQVDYMMNSEVPFKFRLTYVDRTNHVEAINRVLASATVGVSRRKRVVKLELSDDVRKFLENKDVEGGENLWKWSFYQELPTGFVESGDDVGEALDKRLKGFKDRLPDGMRGLGVFDWAGIAAEQIQDGKFFGVDLVDTVDGRILSKSKSAIALDGEGLMTNWAGNNLIVADFREGREVSYRLNSRMMSRAHGDVRFVAVVDGLIE